MSGAPGAGTRPRPLDRRIVVVWTVQDALGYGLLALLVLAMDIGAGLAGAGVPGPPGLAARPPSAAAWPPGGGRGPATAWRYQVAADALELRHGVVRQILGRPLFRVSTSTSPKGRSSGWSACPGWCCTPPRPAPTRPSASPPARRRPAPPHPGQGRPRRCRLRTGRARGPGLRRGAAAARAQPRVLRHQARLAAQPLAVILAARRRVPAARRRGAGAAGLEHGRVAAADLLAGGRGPAAGGGGAGPQAAGGPLRPDPAGRPGPQAPAPPAGVATLRVETAGGGTAASRPGRGHPGRGAGAADEPAAGQGPVDRRARVEDGPTGQAVAASKGRGSPAGRARGRGRGDGRR